MIGIRTYAPRPEHIALMEDFKAALTKNGKDMTPTDMLAIASQLVGQLVALQDQTKYTVAQIMDLVSQNIEIGNRTAINTFLGTTAGKA